MVRKIATLPACAIRLLLACVALSGFDLVGQQAAGHSWTGTLTEAGGQPVAVAQIDLRSTAAKLNAVTDQNGNFRFAAVPPETYTLSVSLRGRRIAPLRIEITASILRSRVTISQRSELLVDEVTTAPNLPSSGGERLTSKETSELPLNKRDFSQLLLLAAGTMTDTNGATNFTQQFAVNGQRGVEAVFAMDGADVSDPEMGGATFSNFNVDAVAEIQSNSGWMPAEIGRGAAGFTNIITRSGRNGFHGSLFEFVRNSAFDARNFFDRRSVANPGRIPPFRRNEFGLTNGGPVWIPKIYNGRNRTFYFVQYQGFRQVRGTTQVIPVPTAGERAGLDTTAYAGDTLLVPVDRGIAKALNRYPLPNDPGGPFGARTFATSSKVSTDADQFSLRIDHKLSEKGQLFGRFNLNNLSGPTTNPSQTAIDPSFGVEYLDRQRNAVVTYVRTFSPAFSSESSISFTRTTPSFPTPNRTDPALHFGDGLYEAFNSAAGSVMASYGNLYQGRQNFSLTVGKHALKFGEEFRANRDTTYFGTSPNGDYTFGGGTAYAPVRIRSLSGTNDVAIGDPLPDTLSGLLTASPFSYTVAVAPPYFPQGDQIGVAAISRYNVNFYFQDTWKISPRLVLDYGLRYEVYWPISERAKRTAGLRTASGGVQEYVINPQPGYKFDLSGFGPRVRLEWRPDDHLQVRVGGAITTIPPNIWQDNFLTGATPFVIYPRATAAPGAPVVFGNQITPQQLPKVYTPAGQDIFATGDTKAVPANTVMDVNRFERELAALTPSRQITPLNVTVVSPSFRNSYLASWTFGLERQIAGLDANAAYVGTAGVRLPAADFPNAYGGADPAFAPHTQFNSAGHVTGGFGTEMVLTNRSHSTYHALQTSLSGTAGRLGPSIQVSYTWSKSLDDTSAVTGGFVSGTSGASAQAFPQNPYDTRAEKGPSTFDTRHVITLSAIQDLHADRAPVLSFLGRRAMAGWQLLSIATMTTGSPFTIYSGVQQTGVGSNGVDRPDQVGTPILSTNRTIREDYFGLGAANASLFAIPVGVVGGTGPNLGRFGTLGRNTFRGPAFHNFDFALIKDTPFGKRGSGELLNLQFRAEFFNLFNIVNFGLPSNIVRGTGFGQISRTAGTSRQIQFSLKLMF